MNQIAQQTLSQSEWEDVAMQLAIDGANEHRIAVQLSKHGCPPESAQLAAREATRRLSAFDRKSALKIVAGGIAGIVVSYLLLGLIEDTTQKVPVKFVLFFGMSIACILFGAFKFIVNRDTSR